MGHPFQERQVALVALQGPSGHVENRAQTPAVEPTTGTGVFLLLPTVEGHCLELFLEYLRHELGEGPIRAVLDSSDSHRRSEVRWPQDMHPLYLPPTVPN